MTSDLTNLSRVYLFLLLIGNCMKYIVIAVLILLIATSAKAQLMVKTNQSKIDSLKLQPIRLVPDNYYSCNLGFMCKKEIEIQKSTRLPLKIRLGSVEDVDKMEGKGTGRN